MRPRPLALSLPALLALGCGSPPPPAPATAVVPPGPVASASSAPEPQAPPEEPDSVRCGVDDRPRPVGEGEGLSPAERSLLGEPMPSPPPPPRVGRRPTSADQLPAPPSLEVRVQRGEPRAEGGARGALTAGLVEAAAPEACDALASTSDSGPLELRVDLASTAEPLRVRSSRPGAPSPYVRCLMERACQIKVSPGPGAKRLSLPLEIEVREPPPPEPPEPPAPSSSLAGRPAPGKEGDELHQMVVQVALQRGLNCVRGKHLPGGVLRFGLDLSQAPAAPGSFLGAPPPLPVGPRMQITRVTSEGLPPAELRPVAECLARALTGATFFSPRKAPRQAKVKIELRVTEAR